MGENTYGFLPPTIHPPADAGIGQGLLHHYPSHSHQQWVQRSAPHSPGHGKFTFRLHARQAAREAGTPLRFAADCIGARRSCVRRLTFTARRFVRAPGVRRIRAGDAGRGRLFAGSLTLRGCGFADFNVRFCTKQPPHPRSVMRGRISSLKQLSLNSRRGGGPGWVCRPNFTCSLKNQVCTNLKKLPHEVF